MPYLLISIPLDCTKCKLYKDKVCVVFKDKKTCLSMSFADKYEVHQSFHPNSKVDDYPDVIKDLFAGFKK